VRSAVGARWRRPASELESADGRLLLEARSGGASGGWGGADEAAVGRERPNAAVAGRSGEASQRAAALVLAVDGTVAGGVAAGGVAAGCWRNRGRRRVGRRRASGRVAVDSAAADCDRWVATVAGRVEVASRQRRPVGGGWCSPPQAYASRAGCYLAG